MYFNFQWQFSLSQIYQVLILLLEWLQEKLKSPVHYSHIRSKVSGLHLCSMKMWDCEQKKKKKGPQRLASLYQAWHSVTRLWITTKYGRIHQKNVVQVESVFFFITNNQLLVILSIVLNLIWSAILTGRQAAFINLIISRVFHCVSHIFLNHPMWIQAKYLYVGLAFMWGPTVFVY